VRSSISCRLPASLARSRTNGSRHAQRRVLAALATFEGVCRCQWSILMAAAWCLLAGFFLLELAPVLAEPRNEVWALKCAAMRWQPICASLQLQQSLEGASPHSLACV